MTETTEVPTLGPGPELTRMLAALAYTAGQALQRRRRELDQGGGSAAAAVRRDEQIHRRVNPAVTTLTEGELAGFDHARAHAERATHPAGGVDVAVGPLTTGGWGLIARGAAGSSGVVAAVRCAGEHVARSVAEEVLARGPEAVVRLHQVAAEATRRSAAAARGLAEPEEQLWLRAARAVREVWPGRAQLVEQVLHGDVDRTGWSPAFAVLAARLQQLEERGYPMGDVLGCLDVEQLARPGVRDPAAVAEHLISTGVMPGLAVVNLGGPIRSVAPSATDHAATSRDRPSRAAGGEREPDVSALLTSALPIEVLTKVRGASGYRRLVDDLHERVERGEDVATLLNRLPVRRIAAAHDPAAYLAACVRRAASDMDFGLVVVPAADAAASAVQPSGTVRDDDAAAHAAAAAVADARAAGYELDAAVDRATPDDPATATREDVGGDVAARGGDVLAATERTLAGTEHAAAAAARAALTPSGTSGLHVVTRGQAGSAVRSALRSQRRPVGPARVVAPRRAERGAHR